ncbi:MAG: glutamate--cysteine ligase [Rhodospirillales bacterium]|nr:glutamate--cysteine ligase [Rhodospirillaceae bacterium]MDP6430606.1 glutamate--cysteine ligase [Rhodospirillales bacterium]MDP6644065.1 glutamate--cysteine ligase [Rhodospirillales bacterium]MDP6842707.1 glutamate--cysteine ligase [Rhodospirillales bacterium]
MDSTKLDTHKSDVPGKGGEVITDTAQLTAYLESGCKPRADWRIGTEHEKFVFDPDGLKPVTYEGPKGIGRLLDGLTRFGWAPVLEGGKVIALSKPDGSSVTLEPGGQLELSGAPLETIHQTCSELTGHLKQVKEVAGEMGVGVMGIGYAPTWDLGDINWMPKGRYQIMRDYMPKKGSLGHHMMLATCTVQVNLDFSDEARMVRMFRAGLALQPIATALWANSPFQGGAKNGFASYRSHIWTDTDPDRCGMLPFVFEDGFGFERYVEYVLDVPMYFVYRDGAYVDASGQSFRDFLAGKLPALPGEVPTIKDWEDHMTTVFPEVRLKHFLEMRGTDGGPWGNLCALPAFWVGLLYDDDALDASSALIGDWTMREMEDLRAEVPKSALKTPFRGGTVQDLAQDVLDIARQGLQRRARLDGGAQDETSFLNPLLEIARTGITPADEILALYDGDWGGDVTPVFEKLAY